MVTISVQDRCGDKGLAFALLFLMIYTKILLIGDKCAIQRNNMKHQVVTAQLYEVGVLMLITLRQVIYVI